MVWFTGKTPYTIVGLGGSLRHVIGYMEQEDIPDSYSNLAYIVGLLANELEISNESFTHRMDESEIRREALLAVEFALNLPRVPSQKLEFLAKTLLIGPNRDRSQHIVVGSPIYVAMA